MAAADPIQLAKGVAAERRLARARNDAPDHHDGPTYDRYPESADGEPDYVPLNGAAATPANQRQDMPKIEIATLPPLTLDEWRNRDLPDPDFIMGHWLTTTSRVLLTAATGLGKTNFGLALGMRIAAGEDFLHWRAHRPARVLYIDGEMSRRLLRERVLDEEKRIGITPEAFFALSHEDIPNFKPLNTIEGQAWMNAFIEKVGGVDLVIPDNIMSLTTGDQKDSEPWQQTIPWALSLTKRQIGQVWVHHTGHDESRNALGTARNNAETSMEQGKTTAQHRKRNSETSLYRGGETVSPSRAPCHTLRTIHSRTGCATPCGLRLPDARCLAKPSNICPHRLDEHSTDGISDQLHGDGSNSSFPRSIDTSLASFPGRVLHPICSSHCWYFRKFQFNTNGLTCDRQALGAAHELAVRQDSDAETAFRALLQLMDPEDLIAGINKDECCHRCQPNTPGGCVITAGYPYAGSQCGHPIREKHMVFGRDANGVRQFLYRQNATALKVFTAAAKRLGVA
jgi:hypothetical protein